MLFSFQLWTSDHVDIEVDDDDDDDDEDDDDVFVVVVQAEHLALNSFRLFYFAS